MLTLLLLPVPEPSGLSFPLLQPLPSSSSLARPAAPRAWPPPMQHLLWLPFPLSLGDWGGHRLWAHPGPGPIQVELNSHMEMAEWEGRGGRRRGGVGRREELPARSPWAAVPTYLAALDPESVLLGGLAVGACLFPVNGHLQGAGGKLWPEAPVLGQLAT